jgi:predicted small lipoprotein YifL
VRKAARKHAFLLVALLTATIPVGGCGLKGPLYLPEKATRLPSGTEAPAPENPDAKRDAQPAR